MAETSVVDVQQSPSPANVLSTLTSDQRAEWRKTGELPKAEEKKAEPEVETEPSGATEEEAESSTASEAEVKEQKPRHNAETRIRDLNAKLKAANERIKQLEVKPVEKTEEKTEKRAESSPAPELKRPVRPKMDDFDGSNGKTLEDYDAAMAKYEEDLADWKSEEKIQRLKAELAQQEAINKTADTIKEARTRYKDWDDVAKPLVQGFSDKDVHPEVLKAVNGVKNLPDVLYTIGGDAEAVESLIGAAKSKDNWVDAIRKLSVYEYLVAQELAKPSKAEAKTPETPVTKAPKPATELGTASSTENAATAAVRANDVRGAFREWNRQALEGAKR